MMREIKARVQLKNWAKRAMMSLNSKTNDDIQKNRNLLLALFSFVLAYGAKNIVIDNVEKYDLKENPIWINIQKMFALIDYHIDLDKIDNQILHEYLTEIHRLCADNYDCIDNILGWVYQYMNINWEENKNKDTQFFTDQYMVKYLVDNTLSKVKNIDQYYCIDPACGGGNFLVELIQNLYEKKKWNKENFIKYIQEYIVGYDLDKCLTLLCVININLKLLELDVINIEEAFQTVFNIYYDDNNSYGSLLKNDKIINNKVIRVCDKVEVDYNSVFCNRYTVLITNPPFKGRREQNKEIRDYLTTYYGLSKGDICNAFIMRLFDLVQENGVATYVSQNGWMYLESYGNLRKHMLTSGSFHEIIDMGSGAFYDLSGEKANVSLFVYSKGNGHEKNIINIYDIKSLSYEEKNIALNDESKMKNYLNTANVQDILLDKYCCIEYVTKGSVKEAFSKYQSYSSYAKPMQGTSTGDSEMFVKFYWEVEGDDWISVSKGGGYSKWSGLNRYKVKWGNDGEEIKNHPKSVLRNTKFFEKTELVYSDTGTSGLSVRLLKEKQIFIASGPGIMIYEGDKYNHLAFLNSRIASYYIKVLTPKLTISATYIGKIPCVKEVLFDEEIRQWAMNAVLLKEQYNKKRPINIEYYPNNYVENNSVYMFAVNDFLNDLEIELERLKIEAKINNKIMKYYELDDTDLKNIYDKVGQIPYEIDNQDMISIKELDLVISKSLDNNCCIKPSRTNKQSLGYEGVLEMLAVNYKMNPVKTFDYITKNIKLLSKTINIYFKHTLHRIKLIQVGFGNPDKCNQVHGIEAIILRDINEFALKFDLKNWSNQEVFKWHYNAFLKKPIFTKGED